MVDQNQSSSKERKFLKPLSIAIAAMLTTAPNVGALAPIMDRANIKAQQTINNQKIDLTNNQLTIGPSTRTTVVAMHQSHSSHVSHASHHSHYSGR